MYYIINMEFFIVNTIVKIAAQIFQLNQQDFLVKKFWTVDSNQNKRFQLFPSWCKDILLYCNNSSKIRIKKWPTKTSSGSPIKAFRVSLVSLKRGLIIFLLKVFCGIVSSALLNVFYMPPSIVTQGICKQKKVTLMCLQDKLFITCVVIFCKCHYSLWDYFFSVT